MSLWTDTAPLLFLVVPPSKDATSEQEEARLTLQRWAEHNKWQPTKTRRTITHQINIGSNTGRRPQVMKPHDADDLYRAIHRLPTAVIQIGQPTVLLNPQGEPSDRNLISLERFVRYKAFFRMLGRAETGMDTESLLGGFQNWRQHCACDGERDARCIPLHIFSPHREWENLHEAWGVKSFESHHGKAGSRVDDKDRSWKPSKKSRSDRETVIIAGTALDPTFHWDVNSPDSGGRLCTSTQVWRFRADSYCNVYPNATVRPGQSQGISAKLVYEAPRPGDTPTSGTRSQHSDVPRRGRRR